MLVSAKHQHESTTGITTFPLSWTSRHLPPHPTPLTCYRAPVWVLKRNTFELVLMRWMNLEPIMFLILIPLSLSHTHTHVHSFLFHLHNISGSHAPLHPRYPVNPVVSVFSLPSRPCSSCNLLSGLWLSLPHIQLLPYYQDSPQQAVFFIFLIKITALFTYLIKILP